MLFKTKSFFGGISLVLDQVGVELTFVSVLTHFCECDRDSLVGRIGRTTTRQSWYAKAVRHVVLRNRLRRIKRPGRILDRDRQLIALGRMRVELDDGRIHGR